MGIPGISLAERCPLPDPVPCLSFDSLERRRPAVIDPTHNVPTFPPLNHRFGPAKPPLYGAFQPTAQASTASNPMQANPYQSLVSLLSNILEAYTTAFFLTDTKNRMLHLVAVQSLSRYLPPKISLPLEQSGILSQVQKVGQTIHLEKLQEAAPSLSAAVPFYREGESHIKGLFAMPVADGAGVLYVDTKYGWGFNDKQQKWIREIAAVLQELLTRQESIERQGELADVFAFWERLDKASREEMGLKEYCDTLSEECAALLEADYVFIALREPSDERYRLFSGSAAVPKNLVNQAFSVKTGLVGWVFGNGKPLLIPRLNPQTTEHFLFSPSEGLPHHGTVWGLPLPLPLGHTFVLVFLTRNPTEWGPVQQTAISHMLHLFHLLLEQFYFQEECRTLQTYDLITGLLNPLAFERRVESQLASSMLASTPCTLALIQVEPWGSLHTRVPPKRVRQWQRELAEGALDLLPAHVLAGQLGNNRLGLLLTQTPVGEASRPLSPLMDMIRSFFKGRLRGVRLRPFLSTVGFPQDGTRPDELWPLLYERLYAQFRSGSEATNP